MKSRIESFLLPLAVAICFVLGWHLAVRVSGSDILCSAISMSTTS